MEKILSVLSQMQSGDSMIVGSGEPSDIVLNALGVERRHARFLHSGSGTFIQDLDTVDGTYVNEIEVRGLVEVRPGDRIRIGSQEFVFDNRGNRSAADPESISSNRNLQVPGAGLELAVANAVRTIQVHDGGKSHKRNILDHVTFQVARGAFVGVLGASGSGKSTLMKSLAGLNGLSEGEIRLDGQSASAATLRSDGRIAYLPQDVVIHEQLTPRVALGYIASLKGIGRTEVERDQVVQRVLARTGMADRRDVPVRRLSGGQRKRVALAAELLGDPQLILLDEATSGLDPATEEEMMRLFHSLAEEGRTVVCITHFPGRLHMCDKVLYLMQGKAIFYGAPNELTHFFGVETIEDTYAEQHKRTAQEWEAEFHRLRGPRPPFSPPTGAKTSRGKSQPVSVRRTMIIRQTRDLVTRYFRLQVADWQNLLLLFAQAPVIGLMVAIVFGSIKASFAELHAADSKEVIFVLVVAVLWCAGTASAREIVKEDAILRHEARFGVRVLPYILSKMTLLGALALAQTYLLLLVVRHFTELGGLFEAQYLVLSFAALAGVTLGLIVSSSAGTSERAMTVLPVLLIAQALFSGGLARLEGIIKTCSQLLVPAYWALDGIRATFSTDLKNATYPGAPGHYQPPILGPGGPLPLDLLALACQTVGLLLMTYTVLHLKLNGASLASLPKWKHER